MASSGRKVLICLDGSKESDYAYQWFMKNMHLDRDHVILVYTHEREKGLYTALGTSDLRSNIESVNIILQQEAEDTKRHESRMQQMLRDTNMKGQVMTVSGHAKAGPAIIGVSLAEKVDLIVCGCRGMGTFRRTLLGSVSTYLMHHAHVPVLVCKQSNDGAE